jgi:hypothetical protein
LFEGGVLSPSALQLAINPITQIRAAAVSQRPWSLADTGFRKRNPRPIAGIRIRKPRAGGMGVDAPNIPPVAASVRAVVFNVSVVEAGLAPGVTLVGEKDAAHLLGSPEQIKVTGESNEPNCGVSWMVYAAD